MREAVDSQDRAAFTSRFDDLTAACNACHAAEMVPSFHVSKPETPRSSIRFHAGSIVHEGTAGHEALLLDESWFSSPSPDQAHARTHARL
jgi:hypothetical protein